MSVSKKTPVSQKPNPKVKPPSYRVVTEGYKPPANKTVGKSNPKK